MKATFTINVEISTEEFIALGEKWAEINGTVPPKPDIKPFPSGYSWVERKVKIHPFITDSQLNTLPSVLKKDEEYYVTDEDVYLIRVAMETAPRMIKSAWIHKVNFVLV